ncbi:MAG: GHKL domain-containing protein [Gammaproteobacteria bacterium]|nr:GHKL domain-containing protein [Gammaproteobacteria bacterium]
MKLRSKILLIIIPIILIGTMFLGWWHYLTASTALIEYNKNYINSQLTNYVNNEVKSRYQLLHKNGLNIVPSFTKSYQQEALNAAVEIASRSKGDFLIMNNSGQILKASGIFLEPEIGKKIDRIIVQDKTLELSYKNTDIMHQHVAFIPWGWDIIYGLHDELFKKTSTDIRNQTLIVAGILTIIVIIVTVFLLNRFILVPLFRLKDFSQNLMQVHPLKKTPLNSRDEIGELSTTMVEMAKVINMTQENLQLKVEQQTEELNKTAEAYRLSNVELQRFAYAISHDLQEPLRMVRSYLQLLTKRYQGKLDDDAQEFITYAVDGANRMSLMMEGLLQFARVESQGEPFALIDCEEVLNSTLLDLKLLIDEKNAQIKYEKLPKICADYHQLERLFQNLISNAIKFCQSSQPEITISVQSEPNLWHFSVKDNGIGIPSDKIDHVFSMFGRLHTRNEYPGSGIGLAVSKRIIERHGGTIWVTENKDSLQENETSQGCTFHFTIHKQINNMLTEVIP